MKRLAIIAIAFGGVAAYGESAAQREAAAAIEKVEGSWIEIVQNLIAGCRDDGHPRAATRDVARCGYLVNKHDPILYTQLCGKAKEILAMGIDGRTKGVVSGSTQGFDALQSEWCEMYDIRERRRARGRMD